MPRTRPALVVVLPAVLAPAACADGGAGELTSVAPVGAVGVTGTVAPVPGHPEPTR